MPTNVGGANAAGDVVIAGRNVGGQRTEGVERRFVAGIEFPVHVVLHALQRHVAGAFDHHLHIVLPRNLRQLAEGFELAELGLVVGIGDRAGAHAITQGKRHIVLLANFADFLEAFVEKTFLMVRYAPLGHDRAAAADDTADALGGHGDMTQADAGVDGEIVDPLLGLLDERVAEKLPRQVFRIIADLL